MITDIYLRSEDDPNFVPDTMHIHDEIEETVTQTKMTVLTQPGEVLGEPDFGLNAFAFLYERDNTVDVESLETRSNNQIQTYVTMDEKFDISSRAVQFEIEEFRSGLGLEIAIGKVGNFGIIFE